MSDEKKLGVQGESKGRAVSFVAGGIGAVGLLIGGFYLFDSLNVFGGSEASSLQSTVPAIESNPGVGDPTEEYAKLIQEQNQDKAQQALDKGSSIPTINADIGDPSRFPRTLNDQRQMLLTCVLLIPAAGRHGRAASDAPLVAAG